MTKLQKYLFYLLFATIITGPLGKLPLDIPQINLYFTDIVVGLIILTWIIRIKYFIKILQSDSIAKCFGIFIGITLVSLLFSPINLNINEKFISALYVVRLLSYFFVYFTAKYLIQHNLVSFSSVVKTLIFTGVALAGLGWLQYFLYPDLRNLYYLGWDPHLYRIFSTYFDPNYFGLMMVLTLILLFELVENYYLKTSRLSTSWRIARRIISIGLSIFILITLMFTYSRSSFIAFLGAMLYLSIAVKKIRIIMVIIIILTLSVILLPRPGGAGVLLERVFSIEKRIENWKQAYKIFIDYPILGIGFNTVRYAKQQYNFGQDNLEVNHAGAGFDNSVLFIAATTGLIGATTYLLFLKKVFQRRSLTVKTSIVAIIIHGFFLNSLFFPWVMVWMWVILGINVKTDTSS